jgi:hypothetical protein
MSRKGDIPIWDIRSMLKGMICVPSFDSNTRERRKRQRIGLALDLENLSRDHRHAGDWTGAAMAIGELRNRYAREGRVEFCLAICDRRLARDLGPKLERFAIATLEHNGRMHEADHRLIGYLRILSDPCTTVIIGSGDSIFAPEARRLRSSGKRVEAVARAGSISAELYASVDQFREFPFRS